MSKDDDLESSLKQFLRLKTPCPGCPFLKSNHDMLAPGRLKAIAETLLEDDRTPFICHKTLLDEDHGEKRVQVVAGSRHAFCAGAAAYLLKKGSPRVAMKVADSMGFVPIDQWDEAQDLVVDEAT